MRLRLPALTASLVTAAVLAGCGGGSAEPTGEAAGAAAPKGAAVTVKTFNFQPDPIEVEAGETVTWTNEDSAVHTVTSGTREKKDGEFDLELAESGGTAKQTFEKPGTYEYFCSLHSGEGMTAKVIVR